MREDHRLAIVDHVGDILQGLGALPLWRDSEGLEELGRRGWAHSRYRDGEGVRGAGTQGLSALPVWRDNEGLEELGRRGWAHSRCAGRGGGCQRRYGGGGDWCRGSDSGSVGQHSCGRAQNRQTGMQWSQWCASGSGRWSI